VLSRFRYGLVAEELVASTTKADASETKEDRQRKGDQVPEEDRPVPAWRVGGVLPGPDEEEAGDDEALEGDDQKELPAAATFVETHDIVRGEVAFLEWNQCVGHRGSFLLLLSRALKRRSIKTRLGLYARRAGEKNSFAKLISLTFFTGRRINELVFIRKGRLIQV